MYMQRDIYTMCCAERGAVEKTEKMRDTHNIRTQAETDRLTDRHGEREREKRKYEKKSDR